MNEENLDTLIDREVISAEKIVLYVADDTCQEEAIKNLQDSCKNIKEQTYISSEDMWTTYELN